jgi:hypothetical protein
MTVQEHVNIRQMLKSDLGTPSISLILSLFNFVEAVFDICYCPMQVFEHGPCIPDGFWPINLFGMYIHENLSGIGIFLVFTSRALKGVLLEGSQNIHKTFSVV